MSDSTKDTYTEYIGHQDTRLAVLYLGRCMEEINLTLQGILALLEQEAQRP